MAITSSVAACSEHQYFDDSAQMCYSCPAHAHVKPDEMALSLRDCVCDAGFKGSPADMKECTGKVVSDVVFKESPADMKE